MSATRLTMLKSKIHRAVITQAEPNYVGSITIDSALLHASGILEYEKVHVADIDNGERLETYVIAGEEGSGIICLNGAAARCVNVGDRVIIMAYCYIDEDKAKQHYPNVVLVNEHNQITQTARYEKHGQLEPL